MRLLFKAPPQTDTVLSYLRDEHLVESYSEAKQMKLDAEFLDILLSEMKRRGITAMTLELVETR